MSEAYNNFVKARTADGSTIHVSSFDIGIGVQGTVTDVSGDTVTVTLDDGHEVTATMLGGGAGGASFPITFDSGNTTYTIEIDGESLLISAVNDSTPSQKTSLRFSDTVVHLIAEDDTFTSSVDVQSNQVATSTTDSWDADGLDMSMNAERSITLLSGGDIDVTADINLNLTVGAAAGTRLRVPRPYFPDQASATTSVGTLNGKVPVYNSSGSVVGYLPVYATIT